MTVLWARYIGPKCKLDLVVKGTDLFLKAVFALSTLKCTETPPVCTVRVAVVCSEYGRSACGKTRKFVRIYGVLEKQFRELL